MLIVDHFKPDSSQNMLESVWTAIEYITVYSYIYKEVKFYKFM